MTNETLPATIASAPAIRNRRPRGQCPKKADQSAELVEKKLPEHPEAHGVYALLRAAPNPRTRLRMMIEWRAGLRVSEALALEVQDLSLDVALPTIHHGTTGQGQEEKMVKASSSTTGHCLREATDAPRSTEPSRPDDAYPIARCGIATPDTR